MKTKTKRSEIRSKFTKIFQDHPSLKRIISWRGIATSEKSEEAYRIFDIFKLHYPEEVENLAHLYIHVNNAKPNRYITVEEGQKCTHKKDYKGDHKVEINAFDMVQLAFFLACRDLKKTFDYSDALKCFHRYMKDAISNRIQFDEDRKVKDSVRRLRHNLENMAKQLNWSVPKASNP